MNNQIESRRLQLSEILHEIIGNENVYFQPPESLKMSYPCIRYQRSSGDSIPADNLKYVRRLGYEIMVISRNPSEPAVELIPEMFQYCNEGRHYTADGLNHDVFYIYW